MAKRETKKEQNNTRESVEEFLQRGGKVTYLPAVVPLEEEAPNHIPSSSGAGSTLMSLSEGALYYSESRAKPKERKKKQEDIINFAALPIQLRKFVFNKN